MAMARRGLPRRQIDVVMCNGLVVRGVPVCGALGRSADIGVHIIMDPSLDMEYEVILSRSPAVSVTQVRRLLSQELKCSGALASKIVSEVEELGKAPCFVGPRQDAEQLVKVLQSQSVVAYMSPI